MEQRMEGQRMEETTDLRSAGRNAENKDNGLPCFCCKTHDSTAKTRKTQRNFSGFLGVLGGATWARQAV